MTPGTEQFANFLGRLGHRVVRTETGAWYDPSRLVLLGLPTHEQRTPSEHELRTVMRLGRAVGVRFVAPLDGPGKRSYQLACDDADYDLERLSSNTRSKIRRGLRRCEVRAISVDEAASAGRRAHEDTLARQGRPGMLTGARWDTFWDAARDCPAMHLWGAWHDHELAAFVVAVDFGDAVELLLARSRTDSLGAYPNNALLYSVTQEYLVRRGVREVTFGIESLEEVAELDQFKYSLGFHAKPLRQRVVFHPVLAAALRPRAVRRLFQQWGARTPGQGTFWHKAAGLLRFAEEASY